MPSPTPPSSSIEHFAELSARLDDPFSDRPAVLRAAGLDDEQWGLLVERWSARLATAEGEALAERFGDAYAAAKRRGVEAAQAAAPESTAPRFLSAAKQPWRMEAAAVGIDAPATPAGIAAPQHAPPPGAASNARPSTPEPTGRELAGTTDVDWRTLRAALPFGPPPPSGTRLPPSAPLPPLRLADLGGTLPVGARLPPPVLPFAGAEPRAASADPDTRTPPSDPKPSK